jgi:hypothetical protein
MTLTNLFIYLESYNFFLNLRSYDCSFYLMSNFSLFHTDYENSYGEGISDVVLIQEP